MTSQSKRIFSTIRGPIQAITVLNREIIVSSGSKNIYLPGKKKLVAV